MQPSWRPAYHTQYVVDAIATVTVGTTFYLGSMTLKGKVGAPTETRTPSPKFPQSLRKVLHILKVSNTLTGSYLIVTRAGVPLPMAQAPALSLSLKIPSLFEV